MGETRFLLESLAGVPAGRREEEEEKKGKGCDQGPAS